MNNKKVTITLFAAIAIVAGIAGLYSMGNNSNDPEPKDSQNYSTNLSGQDDTINNLMTIENSQNPIDKGIRKLDYDSQTILANKGDTITNVIPNEGKMENDKFYLIKKEKKSLSTAPVDISVVDSIMDRVYPGAVLLGDSNFVDNRPTLVVTDRKPIYISIDLPGLEGENRVLVDDFSHSTVNAAVDQLINKWQETKSDTHTIPTKTQYNETMVYSMNQLKMNLNIDIKVAEKELGIDFAAAMKSESTYMVAAYKQIFYTVSADLPSLPSNLFGENVTFKDLKQRGVSDVAPPLMINNVAYGRTIYIVLKSDKKSNQVEAAFKVLLKGQKIEAGSEIESIVNSSTFTVVVLGGDSAKHNKLITTDFEEIRAIIKDNAEFSTTNPGYPITYTSSFLKDNAVAKVHNSTDYVETTVTEYSKAQMKLRHNGAYVARYNVQWDEVSYDENGEAVYAHKNWDGNDHDRTAGWSAQITLPPTSRNINVKAVEYTGLVWDPVWEVINEQNIPLAGHIDVNIWGTTLNPHGEIKYE